MRHAKRINHLSRQTGHRKALLRNLAKGLLTHKRITTTLAKAKALRKFVEPVITKSKTDTTHSRRVVFSYFQDKHVTKMLFGDIAAKVAERPGGYTRIVRLGKRIGDQAEQCLIELVDYNTLYTAKHTGGAEKAKGRVRRGGAKRKAVATEEQSAEVEDTAAVEQATA